MWLNIYKEGSSGVFRRFCGHNEGKSVVIWKLNSCDYDTWQIFIKKYAIFTLCTISHQPSSFISITPTTFLLACTQALGSQGYVV